LSGAEHHVGAAALERAHRRGAMIVAPVHGNRSGPQNTADTVLALGERQSWRPILYTTDLHRLNTDRPNVCAHL
jgi:hypothetical protein